MVRSIPTRTMRHVWNGEKGLSREGRDIKRFGSIRFGVNQRSLQQTREEDFKVNIYKTPKLRKNKLKVKTTNITYQKEIFKTKNNLEVILDFKNIQYLSDKFSRRLGVYNIEIVNTNLFGDKRGKKGILSLTTKDDILDIIIKSEEETMFTNEIYLPMCYKDFSVKLKNNFVIAHYENHLTIEK